ncbi:MAG: hypothetical protein GYA51_00840 [Candidatus Methanofastidiosa archaeon]|nr:hypothetical protein [Candidatus Methanofastidiosa archaeon]
MFVKESLEDILQPKPKSEIKKAFSRMDVEEKEKLLFETGMSKFWGSYDDFLDFLDETLSDTGIWETLLELYNNSAFDESPFADNDENLVFSKEDLKAKMGSMDLVEMMLSSLSEESIDKALSKLVPGYLSENVKEVLKPKSQEEIDQYIREIMDIDAIRQRIQKAKGNLIALYVWEPDWDLTKFSKNTDNIINNLIDYVLEAYKNNWKRQIAVYTIDENIEGNFISDGLGPNCSGGVKILLNIWVQEDWQKEKIDLDLQWN